MSKELTKKDNNHVKKKEPYEILTEPSYRKTPFIIFRRISQIRTTTNVKVISSTFVAVISFRAEMTRL